MKEKDRYLVETERMLISQVMYRENGDAPKWQAVIIHGRGLIVEKQLAEGNIGGDYKGSPINGDYETPEVTGLHVAEYHTQPDEDGMVMDSATLVWRRPTLDELAHLSYGRIDELWGRPYTDLARESIEREEREEYGRISHEAAVRGECIACYQGDHQDCYAQNPPGSSECSCCDVNHKREIKDV